MFPEDNWTLLSLLNVIIGHHRYCKLLYYVAPAVLTQSHFISIFGEESIRALD